MTNIKIKICTLNLMEKELKKSIFSIFNFSWIWNVFPYYGKLPEWMLLMTKLSSKTKKIWEDNQTAFINIGNDFRVDQKIGYLSKILKAEDIKTKMKYFRYFKNYNIDTKEVKKIIIPLTSKGINVLIEKDEDLYSSIKLSLFDKESIPKSIKESTNFQSAILNKFDVSKIKEIYELMKRTGAIMIRRMNGDVMLQQVPSHTLYVNELNIFLITERWKKNKDFF